MPVATNGSVELYYETFGDPSGETLLLVNGLGSQCINYDVALCELFVEQGFFVIRFDNRDVGLSSKFDDYTPRVADVVARGVPAGEERVPGTGHRFGCKSHPVSSLASRARISGCSAFVLVTHLSHARRSIRTLVPGTGMRTRYITSVASVAR